MAAFEYRQWSVMRWGKPIPLRVGLNTGRLVLGNIGFPGRMEYSALGDTVNLASRLEQLTKLFDEPIVVSEATRTRLGDAMGFKQLAAAPVKGIAAPVNTFAPMS